MFFCFLMIRRPPRSTRTDTLFPYTTLFRSILSQGYGACPSIQPALGPIEIWVANIRIESATFLLGFLDVVHRNSLPIAGRRTDMRYESTSTVLSCPTWCARQDKLILRMRSEERRVGKEGVSPCRSRWSPDH